MTVTERDRDLMRVLRSSFGLLGVVHEVVLRVQPLTPVKIDYQVLTAQGIRRPFRVHRQCTGCAAAAHFALQRSDHGRTAHSGRNCEHEPLGNLANSQLRDAQCAAGLRFDRRQRARRRPACAPRWSPACRKRCARRSTAIRAACVMHAHEWMRDMPAEAWKARYTYSLWAFPQAEYPKLLAEYFAFCKSYYKENRYRCNVVNGASRLHQDRSSLFSVSFAGPMFTFEPSSTGDNGWDEFLIDFNDFASALGGVPTFNQSRALQPEHVARRSANAPSYFAPCAANRPPQSASQQLFFALIGLAATGATPSRLILQMRLEKPQVFVQISRDPREQVGGIRVPEFGGVLDRASDRFAEHRQLGG